MSILPTPASIALGAAPYVALVGVSLLAWHFDARAVANAAMVRTQAASFKQAQADSDAAWTAKLNTQAQTYTQQQKDAQNAYSATLANASSYTGRFIAAHRLQPEAAQSGSVAPVAAPTETPIAELREEVPTDSVVVSANDVQGCSVTTGYALALRDWALSVTR